MIIKEVKVYPVSYKLKRPFASATGWKYTRSMVFVEIISDEGLSGWGETRAPLISTVNCIEKDIVPYIVGKNPLDVKVIWEQLQILKMKGIPIRCISCIDMALWDLKGKILGISLCNMLGGCFNKEIQPYATAFFCYEDEFGSFQSLEREAKNILSLGFKYIKMKIGFGVDYDIKKISRLRKIIGNDFPVMVDANQSYDFLSILKLSNILKDLKVQWIEEPLPWISISEYKELGDRLNIPLAGGEQESTQLGFFEVMKQRAVQIIQPDIYVCGGITPLIHIMSLAKAFGIYFSPHTFGSIIGLSAAIQLIASFSYYPRWVTINRPILLEWDAVENNLRDKILKKGPKIINGKVIVSEEPGLGVEIDKKALREFAIE